MAFTPSIKNGESDSPDLLARARAGDGESFWRLCDPLKGRLLRQAFALCRHEMQAQDLTQETFLEAWKSIHRFNGQCQFATWLCSILLHRHKSALRHARWRSWIGPFASHDQQAILERVRDGAPPPDDAAELSERSRLVLATLDRLPAPQREVIFLRFYADESMAGIAAALNCSIGTAKSRLFHGLDSLRRMNTFRKELR